MKKNPFYSRYRDFYTYHGHTEIERVRKRGDTVVSRDWLVFDSVEEAMDFFNEQGPDRPAYGLPSWMIHEIELTMAPNSG